ncbi:NaeI family type II restriction endonuclease [Streptomyces sp. NPDC057413]|uniref:NaeI family type II restriction endonuclease n=1 Tax=Streptomyces sp. NPDC057413 TaxID=3346124 RepID=UPI0036AF4CCA
MNDSLFSRDIAAAMALAQPPSHLADDLALEEVSKWLQMQTNFEWRFGQALRQAIDEVLDGQRTGRFDVAELEKTEKTYLGTKVEIVLRAEFGLGRGRNMDYLIAGQEVDSKFTIGANWTIPMEADGHICLLTKADDRKATYKVGLLKIGAEYLNIGKNRDGKKSLSLAGRNSIKWLISDGKLPENILLNLTPGERAAIFKAATSQRGNGGQARTNELFRRVQGRLINRNTVLTVARQDDSLKRVRDARIHLRRDGIIILGHMKQHPRIARELDLPVPDKGSWVAARVTEVDAATPSRKVTEISGRIYAVWQQGDRECAAPDSY